MAQDLQRDLAADTAASTGAAAAAEQSELQDRVSRIIAIANAARASGSSFDLEAARMQLDGVALSSSEVAVIQSFVQGDLIEAQARQLLQNAQTQTDAGKLIAEAQEARIITPDQAGKMIDAVAGKKEAPAAEATSTAPAPVADEPPAIAGRIDPSRFATGTTSPEGAAQSVPRGPKTLAG